MNRSKLVGLGAVALTLAFAGACSDDGATEGGSAGTETGDGDGDPAGDGDGDPGDGDGDPGDGDGDPGDGDGDPGDGDGDPGDGDGDPGDGDGDPGDGDGDGDGDPGDGDGDPGDVCGDGIVTGAEVCDDGINDGGYGGCNADCLSLAGFCGDGEVNGPEACDDQNDELADGCLGDCSVPATCADILAFDAAAESGEYLISPKPDEPWLANCDMTTDGGGWTGITLEHTCNGDLDSTLMAIEEAPDAGVDMQTCQAFSTDASLDHTYVWDIAFPPGFDEFYLADYVAKARAIAPDTSEINQGVFVQTSWDDAHGGTARGDIAFGSADEPGPVTSYAAEGANFECTECEELFPTLDTPFMLGANSATLRIGWGEGGPQDEGWYPWWSGTIYLR